MKRRIATLLIVITLLALSVLIGVGAGMAADTNVTAAPVVTVRIPANQSIDIDCAGDDLLITTNDANDQAHIICRVWFGEER